MLAAWPTVALPSNATVTARVQHREDYGAILVEMCGREHCSRVYLVVNGTGTMHWDGYVETDIDGWYGVETPVSVSLRSGP